MQSKSRMNVYFEPDLLRKVEALALRRDVSKSAVIEAAVASFLSEDSADRREAGQRLADRARRRGVRSLGPRRGRRLASSR